jgi:hypothetical protein
MKTPVIATCGSARYRIPHYRVTLLLEEPLYPKKRNEDFQSQKASSALPQGLQPIFTNDALCAQKSLVTLFVYKISARWSGSQPAELS